MTFSGPRAWLAIFACAAIAAYSSALTAPFEFDDLPAIQQNASIRQLVPLTIPLDPPANTAVSGRPVVNLSLAANYTLNELFGIDQRSTVGYHLVNVLLHLICGALLFGVVRRTLVYASEDDDAPIDAGFVAGSAVVLWLLHPIQTEAVNYVIQRTELLVSVCYAATLYASIRAWDARHDRRRWWYGFAVVACLAGMASKEVMVTAPLIVVLYDRAFRVISWKELLRDRGRVRFYGMLAATTLFVVATIGSNARWGTVGFDVGVPWYRYAYTQAWAVLRYIRLIAWPIGLTFDYGLAPISGLGGIPGLVLLTGLAIATIYAWRRGGRWLQLGFIGAWFFLILAPSSSIVPIRTEIAAERRVYLASAALFVLVAVGAEQLYRRHGIPKRVQRVLIATVAAVLGAVTWTRGLTYRSSETLYRDVIAKVPRNPRGYTGVGFALLQQTPPRLVEAESLFRHAIAVDSTYFAAAQALGVIEASKGNWRDAGRAFQHAARIEPGNRDAAAGAAQAFVQLGEPDSARAYIEQVGPANPDLIWSFGRLLVQRRRGAEALPYLTAVATSETSSIDIAWLSVAFAQSDSVDEAVKAAQVATASAGDTAEVFALAGRAMLIARRTGEAEAYLREALALDPELAQVKQLLDSLGLSAPPRPR